MKKIALVLVISICLVSLIFNYASADYSWSYNFLIDGIEVNISSEEEISEEFAYNIAYRIVCGDGGHDIINGPYCNVNGHTYVNTTATTITHRLYTNDPRCLEKTYSVKTCSVCGYEIRTLISSNRISCCN